MLKSGLIFGGVALVLIGLTGVVNFQLCAPCLALFIGAGAGYVGGLFDKPAGAAGASAKVGAGAGAMAGVGGLLGNLGGGLIGSVMLGPAAANQFARQFGLPTASGPGSAAGYYGGAVAASCCFGLFDIALMAGLGALGGMLWYQLTGRSAGAGAPPVPPTPAM
jgi:hypothetical protein